MGQITVEGGGGQVVQYRTKSGRKSRRLAYNEKQQLDIDDTGDQLWVSFCFFDCGKPESGPADVLPGDWAGTDDGFTRGIGLMVMRGGCWVYNYWTNGTVCRPSLRACAVHQ
jgi:hypothetical protein